MSYRTCRSDKVMVKRNTVSVIARACIQEYVCMYQSRVLCHSEADSGPVQARSAASLGRYVPAHQGFIKNLLQRRRDATRPTCPEVWTKMAWARLLP